MDEVQAPHLDKAALSQIEAMGRPELVARVVDTFFSSTRPRMENMQRAFHAAEFDEIGFEAHTVKSSSASIGALRLSAMCQWLEGEAGNLDADADKQAIGDMISSILQEFEKLQITLNHSGSSSKL